MIIIHCFLIFALKHIFRVLVRTIYVLSKNKKNITIFRLKIFIFSAVKYRSILHGYVCVQCIFVARILVNKT